MNVDLRGKVAVVTGGSGALGSAMCRELAASGAKVAILARGAEKAQSLVDEIIAQGQKAMALSCDVVDVESVSRCAAQISAEFGPCDILVNAAGGNSPLATTAKERLDKDDAERNLAGPRAGAEPAHSSTFFDLDPAGVRSVFDLNFMGTFIPTQAFSRQMLGRRGGSIINIASMGSFAPMTKVPAYCAAKAAIVNLTEWLAVHFAPVGIRVNAIAPGFFLGEQNRRLLQGDDGALTARGVKIIEHTPAGRFGLPEDLVGTLLWLCDESASRFVTGIVVPVDGGFNAYAGV